MKNLFKNNRYLPIIAIVLILVGYFYLSYETFRLSEKSKVLKTEISSSEKEILKLESIKRNLTTDIKIADSIRQIQNGIILKSADPRTVQKGIELNAKINNPESGFFTVNKAGENDARAAASFEADGFRYLLERDAENAVKAFTKSENSYNGFHQVHEISKYLKQKKATLADKHSPFWKTAYHEIALQYSWRMSQEIKTELLKHSE